MQIHILLGESKALRGFANWPKPGLPLSLGGWVKGGWDSYIKTKIFNVRIFDEWLSDSQILAIVDERPEMS